MFWSTIIICACFATPIETPPKHGFWTLQQHLLATSIVDHAFFSWCVGIKRSHGVLSQASLASHYGAGLSRCVRARWTMIRRQSFVFRIINDLINVFGSIAIVFFQHFFTPTDTNLFWAFVKLCGIQRQQIFFTAKCSGNVECMLVHEMPKDASILRYVTWRAGIISSRTTSMLSDKTAVFGGPSRTSSVNDLHSQLISLNQYFHSAMEWCSLLWCKR